MCVLQVAYVQVAAKPITCIGSQTYIGICIYIINVLIYRDEN